MYAIVFAPLWTNNTHPLRYIEGSPCVFVEVLLYSHASKRTDDEGV